MEHELKTAKKKYGLAGRLRFRSRRRRRRLERLPFRLSILTLAGRVRFTLCLPSLGWGRVGVRHRAEFFESGWALPEIQ